MRIPLGVIALAQGTDEVSVLLPMQGYNTIQIELVVFTGAVDVSVENSNDGQDWRVKDSYATVTGPAFKIFAPTPIAAATVRVRWAQNGVGAAVMSGSINLSTQ